MATFALVPGAWLGGWAWKEVVARLEGRGHVAYPVTLTGLGERSHLSSWDITIETHVMDVVNILVYEDLHQVTLVGHSYGGVILQTVAGHVPERVGRLVYLDTGPLPPGATVQDFQSPKFREFVDRDVNERGGGRFIPFPGLDNLGPPSVVEGLGVRERALMTARATPHPYATFTSPVAAGEFHDTHERVLILAGGIGMTVEQLMDQIAAGVPMVQAFATPGWRFERIETGHWPMFSAPSALAEMLHGLD